MNAAGQSDDHALLMEVVREAGAIARDFFVKGAKSWEKRHDDPVSEADIAVNEHLRQRLFAVRPHYGWLSEETADDGSRREARRIWIVDPIDGTRAFLKRQPEFAVSVALVEDGRPVSGVVFNPARDEFYEAFAGGGARLNGAGIRASDRASLAGAQLLASKRTFERNDWLHLTPGANFAYMNSIAYRMAKVASGDFDAAVTFSEKSDWDVAAADLILTEAGAHCTTCDGKPLRYNEAVARHPSVLAAAPGVHPILVKLLTAA
ncbi:MAG TPA: 3'(2'),5'-bisphosphate nucleotidase CysQ [Candidatus Cybelea sp.]|nr:3'(2'),5'-bisphosphate nucleotidase CysQ [Candidatus Cybelea sp.]